MKCSGCQQLINGKCFTVMVSMYNSFWEKGTNKEVEGTYCEQCWQKEW